MNERVLFIASLINQLA